MQCLAVSTPPLKSLFVARLPAATVGCRWRVSGWSKAPPMLWCLTWLSRFAIVPDVAMNFYWRELLVHVVTAWGLCVSRPQTAVVWLSCRVHILPDSSVGQSFLHPSVFDLRPFSDSAADGSRYPNGAHRPLPAGDLWLANQESSQGGCCIRAG